MPAKSGKTVQNLNEVLLCSHNLPENDTLKKKNENR